MAAAREGSQAHPAACDNDPLVAHPTHQALPRVGDFVDQYEVCGEIDSGGMSVIYAVKRASFGGFQKLLAMKVILPNLAREERYKNMFLDEARILSLVQHPNVVSVHDVGETGSGLLYMVMDLLRGRAYSRILRAGLKKEGRVRRDLALSILADAADGLNAAHETKLADGQPANIVHRDVSPQNVHVGYDGTVRVVDFGIAAAEGRLNRTDAGELKGKLAYIAPEQILRVAVEKRADIWSLGVMAWEMLAERRLFSGASEVELLRNVTEMPVPPLSTVGKGVSPAVAEIVMQCLQRDPSRRPASAKVVAAALRAGARRIRPTDPREEVAAWVRGLFAEEVLQDEERLARASKPGPMQPVPAKPARDDTSGPFPLVTIATPTPPTATTTRRRSWALSAAAGGGVAIVLAAVAWAVTGAGEARSPRPSAPTVTMAREVPDVPAVAGATAPPSAPPNAEPAPPAPPPRNDGPPTTDDVVIRQIVVTVDPRLTVVRVDGLVRPERPLRVEVRPGQILRLSGSTRAGDRVDRALDDRAPDRVVLGLPPQKGTKGANPFLGSPYGTR